MEEWRISSIFSLSSFSVRSTIHMHLSILLMAEKLQLSLVVFFFVHSRPNDHKKYCLLLLFWMHAFFSLVYPTARKWNLTVNTTMQVAEHKRSNGYFICWMHSYISGRERALCQMGKDYNGIKFTGTALQSIDVIAHTREQRWSFSPFWYSTKIRYNFYISIPICLNMISIWSIVRQEVEKCECLLLTAHTWGPEEKKCSSGRVLFSHSIEF